MSKTFLCTQLSLQEFAAYSTITVPAFSGAAYQITDEAVEASDHKNYKISSRIILHQESKISLYVALTVVQVATIDIEFDIQGAGAQVEIIILYTLKDTQNITLRTRQVHTGKQTVSRVIVQGILKDRSMLDYAGTILLEPLSKDAQANLQHSTIVFGQGARVVSVPSIQVLHQDVSCAHGAAIGQFDDQHVWYLQSRGFDKVAASSMLAQSFFAEHVTGFVDHQKVLERLCQNVVLM